MIEIVIFIAFVGSLIAGFLDLKTTEFPDDIPYLMIAFGIFIWYIYALTFGDLLPLFLSLAIGTIFGIIGWIAYRAGAWGNGDAAILSAIFFLVPFMTFLIDYISNLLVVSILYLVIYTLTISMGKNIGLMNELKGKKFLFLIYSILLLILLNVSYLFNPVMLIPIFISWLAGLGMIVFTVYAKKIERTLFKKKIPVSRLKEGDVLAISRQWSGLTREEINRIIKKQKYVEIKEGVRFTVVFPITLLITWLFGNVLFLILF